MHLLCSSPGKIELARIPEGIVLPEGADPAKIFGGEHYPMSVQVIVDGSTVLDETYKPSGISGNGRISALKFLEIEPGARQVQVLVRDDSVEYRPVFTGEVRFEKGQVYVLAYDENSDTFMLR